MTGAPSFVRVAGVRPPWLRELGLGFAVSDRNLARLFRLGDLAHEVNVQEAVRELRAGDLDVVGELEAALERAGRDALIEHLTLRLGLLLLLAFHGERIFLGFDRQFILGEARDRNGNAIGVFAGTLDVIGRISGGRAVKAGAIEHREQAVEADGGTVEGSKIESSHGISSLKRHADDPPRTGPDRNAQPDGLRKIDVGRVPRLVKRGDVPPSVRNSPAIRRNRSSVFSRVPCNSRPSPPIRFPTGRALERSRPPTVWC